MPNNRNHPPYERITSRWGGMETRIKLGTKIAEWISLFNEEDQTLIVELLGNFQYYTEKRIGEKVVDLFQVFRERYPYALNTAVYFKPVKEYGTSFSSVFFTSFWLKNGLNDYAEENIIELLSEDVVPPNLVVVDDYSGSGATLIKTINKLLETNSGVATSNIFLLVFLITDDAEQAILQYASETGLNIDLVCLEKTRNAFTRGYIFDANQVDVKRAQYIELYDRFALKPEYRFGFLDVASLVAFHYNTPNNTLGLFWQDLADYCALFPRHKTVRTYLRKMQNEAKARKQDRRIVKIIGIDEGRQSAMMVYCVSQGKALSIEQMRNDFGLTEEQINHDLKAIIDKGYLVFQDDQLVATPKLKSHLFVSRLNAKKKKESELIPTESRFSQHEEYIPLHFD